MSIANFGELKTAVGSWLNRADLAAQLPDFITLGAGRIYYGSEDDLLPSPPVRTWSMQARETPTPVSGFSALPTRYLATIRLAASAGGGAATLTYISPSSFSDIQGNGGIASQYTILNAQIAYGGSGTATFTHDYYQSFAAFSADADINALLTASPGLWLHAALLEANIYLGDDESAKKAHRMYLSAATGLNKNAREFGGGTLRMKAA